MATRTGQAFNTATVETVNYKQGTLTILVDAKQKVLVWRATAEGRVLNGALR
jgi:hypothetical protein